MKVRQSIQKITFEVLLNIFFIIKFFDLRKKLTNAAIGVKHFLTHVEENENSNYIFRKITINISNIH